MKLKGWGESESVGNVTARIGEAMLRAAISAQ
jgi:hypothetical protein